ncbi:MAG TPA: dihydrodipicolinate synthase family protein [Pyrinomonadaceae bacterium]|nr:dihydrodipicolinate synthase family protein [Pyrinomonadaceae bacterium]
MSINLSGVLLPMTTPFTATEDVDVAALNANIDRWNPAGISGYVVLGSTGERVNLDEREYLQVIEATRAAVPETMTFIVGAGQQSTRGTIAEIGRAAKAGAEAVLVITPHYYRNAINQQTLIEHYTAVADAVSVPVILYSMPDLTGIKIEPETAARLSEHPNIIGLKDSSNDVAKMRETVETVQEGFAVTVGNGTVFREALQAGAVGGILAVGCVVPELCLEIYRAVRAGEIDRATSLQEKLTPLARAVTRTYGIGGLKAAMDMGGYVGGIVRAPLQPASEAARTEIKELLLAAAPVSEPGAEATRRGSAAR